MHSMRPRSCGCSVRRHIRTASEGIRASEAAVVCAIERYCAVPPASRRHVSFAPGPLESRRRLGRRHMTELYSFQSHASLPPWAFEMPSDLGKWNWYPPTLRNNPINGSIMEQSEDDSSQPWLPSILGQPPPNTETSSPANAEANGSSAAEDDVESDIHWFMEQARSKDSGDIQPYMDIFVDSLKAHARNGNLVPGHVYQISTTLPALLAVNHRNRDLASLLGAICEVTGSVMDSGCFEFDPSFWSLFLKQLTLLGGNPIACDIFADFMSLIPRPHIDHVYDAVGVVVASISRNISDSTVGLASDATEWAGIAPMDPYEHPELWPQTITALPYQRYAIPIARGLSRFDGEDKVARMIDALKITMASLRPRERRAREKIRVMWLSILARTPFVRQHTLFQSTAKMFNGGARRNRGLSDAVITQLLALHWTSRGYLDRPPSVLLSSACDAQKPELVRFLFTICHARFQRCRAAYVSSLCKYLRFTGKLGSLVDSLEVLCVESEPRTLYARPFAVAASTCDDYRTMMRLYRLTGAYYEKFNASRTLFDLWWDWTHWARKVYDLSRDHSVNPHELRILLGVGRDWQWQRKGHPLPDEDRMVAALSIRTVSLLEDSANRILYHFVLNPPYGRSLERTALDLIQKRIRCLKVHGVRVTNRMLKTLAKLIVIDLVRGQPGRTTRLQWLVRLVAENQGHEAAAAVAQELDTWRKRNFQLARSSPNKNDTNEEAIRLLHEPPKSELDEVSESSLTKWLNLVQAGCLNRDRWLLREPSQFELDDLSESEPDEESELSLTKWLNIERTTCLSRDRWLLHEPSRSELDGLSDSSRGAGRI